MGDIIAQGSKAVGLNLNTAINETDSGDEWDTTPRDSCFYYWWRCPIVLAAKGQAEMGPRPPCFHVLRTDSKRSGCILYKYYMCPLYL